MVLLGRNNCSLAGIVIGFVLISADELFPELQHVFQQVDIGVFIAYALSTLIEV